jgi:uncharacterized Zn-finger protein
VGGDEQAAALARELDEQALQPLRARRVQPGERLVEHHHGRVLHEGARHQDALALAARQRAEGRVGLRAEAHPVERRAGLRALGAAGPPPPRQPPHGAHRRHVEGGDREVQARALRLRHHGAARALEHPRVRLELAEQSRNKVVFPPPFGPRTPTRSPARTLNDTSRSTTSPP